MKNRPMFVAVCFLMAVTMHRYSVAREPGEVSDIEAASTADKWLLENSIHLYRLSNEIWRTPELGFQEHKACELLATRLESNGFSVERNVAQMKTAFVAKFGSGSPTIALLAEYDALPGMSQKLWPTREQESAGAPGHACGHNLLGVASVEAAIAVKEAIVQHKIPGTVIVFGTPAEEGGGGKVYMVRDGLFEGVDAVLAWHPDVANYVRAGSSLALRRMRFRFTGVAAHAALKPDEGKSALDAVELMNVGVNFLREHVPQDIRIHYVISRGGERPNVVPAEAESWYYVRGPKMSLVNLVTDRVSDIANGACLMTGAKVEMRDLSGTHEILSNQVLAGVVHEQLHHVGAPPFDPEDIEFGRKIERELNPEKSGDSPLAEEVLPIVADRLMASSDVGDVSWVVPTVELRVATTVKHAAAHTWAFTATAGGPIGNKGGLTAARVLARSAVVLLMDSERLSAAKEEFRQQTKDYTYSSPIPAGVRPPEKIDP